MSTEQGNTRAPAVLVVDDDRNVCDLICEELADRGYGAAAVSNGREALDYLRGPAPAPKLILLDLMMPVMNGWEFQKARQDDPALSCIPVAIITGLDDGGEKARRLGAVDVLVKPSRIEDLYALAARFCGRPPAALE